MEKLLYSGLVAILIMIALLITGVIKDSTGVIDRVKEIRIDVFELETKTAEENNV